MVGEHHGLAASGCPELIPRFLEWESNNQTHHRPLPAAMPAGWLGKEEVGRGKYQRIKSESKGVREASLSSSGEVLETSSSPLFL